MAKFKMFASRTAKKGVVSPIKIKFRQKWSQDKQALAPYDIPAQGDEFTNMVIPLNYLREDLDLTANLNKVIDKNKLTDDDFLNYMGVRNVSDLPKSIRDELDKRAKKDRAGRVKKKGVIKKKELANLLTEEEILKILRVHKAGAAAQVPAELPKKAKDAIGRIRTKKKAANRYLGLTIAGVAETIGTALMEFVLPAAGVNEIDLDMPWEHHGEKIPTDTGVGGGEGPVGGEGVEPEVPETGIGGEGEAPIPSGGEPAWHESAWERFKEIISTPFQRAASGRMEFPDRVTFALGRYGLGLTVAAIGARGYRGAHAEYMKAMRDFLKTVHKSEFKNVINPETDLYKHCQMLQDYFNEAMEGGRITVMLHKVNLNKLSKKSARHKEWVRNYREKYAKNKKAKYMDVVRIHFDPTIKMRGANVRAARRRRA